jgi:ribosomal protein S18 acetylase RimI-like enzyme
VTDIRAFSAAEAESHLPALVSLLRVTVDDGASIGFLPPLSHQDAAAYWREVLPGVADGGRVLIGAVEDGRLLGCVQLALEGRPNARHRAEIQKLMVLPQARGRGLGAALMVAADDAARTAGRTLLVLDTRAGDTAEGLYRRLGWTEAGRIPGFALNAEGGADATVLFYRELPPAG